MNFKKMTCVICGLAYLGVTYHAYAQSHDTPLEDKAPVFINTLTAGTTVMTSGDLVVTQMEVPINQAIPENQIRPFLIQIQKNEHPQGASAYDVVKRMRYVSPDSTVTNSNDPWEHQGSPRYFYIPEQTRI